MADSKQHQLPCATNLKIKYGSAEARGSPGLCAVWVADRSGCRMSSSKRVGGCKVNSDGDNPDEKNKAVAEPSAETADLSRALSYDYNNYDYDYPIDSSCVRLPNRPNRLTLASNYPIDVSTEEKNGSGRSLIGQCSYYSVQDFTWQKCFRIPTSPYKALSENEKYKCCPASAMGVWGNNSDAVSSSIARYRYRWTPLAYRGYCCIYVF
ncbi:hypothetical protein T4E_4124 [Trichinella pseudospiralis]|uniref:Uncharacterized protein n=1 Tax=Trichinella pseudospiralis TaxID=6337 RepID=A0A0V0XLT5_TRIPS|nr:hypothetical protein T4E_4124 [Trichinella pseudospiralis]